MQKQKSPKRRRQTENRKRTHTRTHAHARMHARAHARKNAHTHTHTHASTQNQQCMVEPRTVDNCIWQMPTSLTPYASSVKKITQNCCMVCIFMCKCWTSLKQYAMLKHAHHPKPNTFDSGTLRMSTSLARYASNVKLIKHKCRTVCMFMRKYCTSLKQYVA